MAAGVGSRFGGLKQLAEVGPSGEALFDYAAFDGVRSGFDRVVFVVSDRSRPAVEEHVSAGLARHVDTAFVDQDAGGRAKPWGTGHAVLTACAAVGGAPYAVINADDFYGRRSYEALAAGLRIAGEDHVLVGFRLAESLTPNGGVSRGVIDVDADGVLTSIRELHDVGVRDGQVTCREGVALTGDELISANLWGFRPSFCDALRAGFDEFRAARGDDPDAEYLIGDAVERERDSGGPNVRVVPTPEHFMGVTFREDRDDVRAAIAALVDAGEYPAALWP